MESEREAWKSDLCCFRCCFLSPVCACRVVPRLTSARLVILAVSSQKISHTLRFRRPTHCFSIRTSLGAQSTHERAQGRGVSTG